MMGWRYGIILPLAGGMTLTLAMVMKALVKTEFVPQPTDRYTTSTAAFIDEPIIICGGYRGSERLTVRRFPLLVPPYQKTVSDQFLDNPHYDRQTYVAPKPDDLPTKLDVDISAISARELSCHWNHGVRVPPKFPKAFLEGNSSGLCKVNFVYDENGQTSDVGVQNCTHLILESPTRKAVRRWQKVAGVCHPAISVQRQFSTIRYDLIDESGKLLPLP